MNRTNFQQKWLQINEETAYTKLTSNTKISELGNLGKYLYKTKRKWEHTEENLVRNGGKNTVNINRDIGNLIYRTQNLRQ